MKPNGELTEEEANALKIMLRGHPGLKANGDLSPELATELRQALGIADTSSQVWSYEKNVAVFIGVVLFICFVLVLIFI